MPSDESASKIATRMSCSTGVSSGATNSWRSRPAWCRWLQPPDRVSYRMLTPTDEDLQKIHDMALKAGLLDRPVDMKELIDRQFIPADIKPAKIDASQPITPPQ